jgi:cytochrome c-type biogenesis protein CcmH/NrfF
VRRALATALVTLIALAAPAAAIAQQCPRTTLGDIEDEVMCVLCKRPLNTVDREPQAQRERAFIQTLIDQCKTKQEIKDALADQFGPRVLALPDDGGFNATAYIVPVAGPLAALALIALAAARWRGRRPAGTDGDDGDDAANATNATGAAPSQPALDPGDSARLDEDLERYKL